MSRQTCAEERFSALYDARVYDPASVWGAGVILVPVIGGLGVVFLVSKFAPEARGRGVPEVMHAVFYRDGKIRPIVAVVKSLASALSIGTGAAVGREGPIVQIGASLGSTASGIPRSRTSSPGAWSRDRFDADDRDCSAQHRRPPRVE